MTIARYHEYKGLTLSLQLVGRRHVQQPSHTVMAVAREVRSIAGRFGDQATGTMRAVVEHRLFTIPLSSLAVETRTRNGKVARTNGQCQVAA